MFADTSGMDKQLLTLESARHIVRNDLDHIAIRDSGRKLLSKTDASTTILMMDMDQVPDAIAQTSPTLLKIDDGTLIIEYGGGFGHYGLVVVPDGDQIPYGERIADGIAYYETE